MGLRPGQTSVTTESCGFRKCVRGKMGDCLKGIFRRKEVSTKKAVLVGCNYKGTDIELFGCINDVAIIKDLLVTRFGFQEEDVMCLVDTSLWGGDPTGKEIRTQLGDMCKNSKPGDILVFHFSGHGVLVPDLTEGPNEFDSSIVPSDLNLISDDDIRAMVSQCPEGVHFTMISDCCHSESLLDGTNIVHEDKGTDPTNFPGALDGISNGVREQELGKDRSLSPEQLAQQLSKNLGTSVDQKSIMQAVHTLFGDNSSPFVKKYVNFINQATEAVQDSIATLSVAPGASVATGGASPRTRSASPSEGQQVLEKGGQGQQKLQEEVAKGSKDQTVPTAHAAVRMKMPNVGVLITGCQKDETSADATIPATGEAHGAFTYALKQVLDANPGRALSNIELVLAVRSNLLANAFKQNPVLECDPETAKTPFICPLPT